jgi:adenylate cyclase
MKRSTLAALIIGFVVSGIVIALQVSGGLLRVEFLISDYVARHTAIATSVVAEQWQYVVIAVVALIVAWFTIENTKPRRSWWLLAVLSVELIGAAWVLGLYKIFFQPLPSVLAVILSFVAAQRYSATAVGTRRRVASQIFSGRLSRRKIDEVATGSAALDRPAAAHEATALVCDIANKIDLADEIAPNDYADISRKFIERAAEVLRANGAYIHAADGEGVLALFGYPAADSRHAEEAARAALTVTKAFSAEPGSTEEEARRTLEIHVGASSGTLIAANLVTDGQSSLLLSGEPVELARRLCIANRSYGSHILIGPKTFELASESIVARPIDFLMGAEARDRLEVYELLSLAAAANPEVIARRDSFWNGIVYYREKRWGEAYAAFQKAAAANGKEDAPVQLYLRRIEPLLLHLAESPSAAEPPL